jgi:hexosaminidase
LQEQKWDGASFVLPKPEIYDFVSDVIGEMAAITTGPWIHIGGDEIKDDLYETFVVKADSIVQKYGKTSIGWEEVTKGPGTVVL